MSSNDASSPSKLNAESNDVNNENEFKKPHIKKKTREVTADFIEEPEIKRMKLHYNSFWNINTSFHYCRTDFIITASVDGHLKFWKKKYAEGVEFVKHFRCHLNSFSHLCVNFNGTLLATVCQQDKSVKIFDVENFDMINMLKFDFASRTACWIHQGSDVVHYLAVCDADSGKIVIVDGKGNSQILHTIDKLHYKSVCQIEYSHVLDVVVSIDDSGMIEYWSGAKKDYGFPDNIHWKYKTETDLYEFMRVRLLFNICKNFLLSLQLNLICNNHPSNFGLQNMEWNRRVAIEKDIDKDHANAFRYLKLCWDYSGYFLMYPTPIGIKVYNVVTDKVVREIGKDETARFIAASLCRAVPDIRARLQGAAVTIETEAADNPNLNKTTDPDPIMVCCAHKKNRFYLFTNAEPFSTEEGEDGGTSSRDVFNERPKKEDQLTAVEQERETGRSTDRAILHTSLGDIHMKLFAEECPRTVENFCTHARRGYFNGLTFHRVIKSFMIQISILALIFFSILVLNFIYFLCCTHLNIVILCISYFKKNNSMACALYYFILFIKLVVLKQYNQLLRFPWQMQDQIQTVHNSSLLFAQQSGKNHVYFAKIKAMCLIFTFPFRQCKLKGKHMIILNKIHFSNRYFWVSCEPVALYGVKWQKRFLFLHFVVIFIIVKPSHWINIQACKSAETTHNLTD
uniref:peptidylprolyl isomerase n=1 Tax=Heterorhabditis bacteriophora TaxID=37862 RepID=A0A1I7WZ24_HETBA